MALSAASRVHLALDPRASRTFSEADARGHRIAPLDASSPLTESSAREVLFEPVWVERDAVVRSLNFVRASSAAFFKAASSRASNLAGPAYALAVQL